MIFPLKNSNRISCLILNKKQKIKIHKFCENIFHCLSCGSIDYKFSKTVHGKFRKVWYFSKFVYVHAKIILNEHNSCLKFI